MAPEHSVGIAGHEAFGDRVEEVAFEQQVRLGQRQSGHHSTAGGTGDGTGDRRGDGVVFVEAEVARLVLHTSAVDQVLDEGWRAQTAVSVTVGVEHAVEAVGGASGTGVGRELEEGAHVADAVAAVVDGVHGESGVAEVAHGGAGAGGAVGLRAGDAVRRYLVVS